MMSLTLFLTFILPATILWLWYRRRKPIGHPPGYSGLPVLGILPFLSSHLWRTFMKWGEKLGPVFYIQMGFTDTLVLNDYDSIHECFVNLGKFTADRADMTLYRTTRKAPGMELEHYGKTYIDVKKNVIKAIKSFGLSKDSLESMLHEELEYLTEEIIKFDGKPFDPKDLLNLASTCVISNVVFGKRLGYKDPRLLELMKKMQAIFNNERDNTLLSVMLLYPMLRFVPVFRPAYKRLYNNVEERSRIFRQMFEEHEKSFNKNNLRDIIDHFILQRRSDPKNPAFFVNNIVQILTDIFDGGIATVPIYLLFCFLYLAKHPDIQSKLFDEINNEIGATLPGIKQFERISETLPNVASFLDEISRHRTLVPVGVFHKTSEDIKLFGYTIPKNTEIIPNMYAAHHDPKYFHDPERFIPERFIQNGKYEKSKHLIPFSIGPRKCPGFELANKKIFVWFCGILQRFEIKENPDFPLPDFDDGLFGVIYFPKEFKVEFQQR